MPESALLVEVPAAEPAIGRFRLRYDPVAQRGVPAHVTVLFPFVEPSAIDDGVIASVAGIVGAHEAFSYSLVRVSTFPGVVYLAPEPAAPFIALTEAVAAAFPDYPPYRGAYDDTVPHLSVAMDADDARREEIEIAVASQLPIAAEARELCLYVSDDRAHWACVHRFNLA